jgi:chromosome partitioning protein
MKCRQARTGKLIAVANMKGGVGKTTTVVSLAEALVADDLATCVLVVDLDPQASASLCLAGDDVLAEMIEAGRTLQNFLEIRLIERNGTRPIEEFIRSFASLTTHQGVQLPLSLLPCGPRLRLLEREIIYALTKYRYSMNAIEGHLWKVFDSDFAPLRAAFDYVIFDCPPGISPFTEVTIRASDLIIVPTIPDRISNFGLNAFCSGFWQTGMSALPKPPLPYVLISRMQNVTQHKDMILRLEAEANAPDAAFRLLETRIPQSAALAKALSPADDTQTFTKKYTLNVAQILAPLAAEIKELLNGDRH